MAPAGVTFNIYQGLGSLPLFNDSNDKPTEVAELINLIKEADGVLICTPEYAFGVPGVLKNALDWTVSSGVFDQKPVAVITGATGGDKAHASLLLTLTALSTIMTEDAKLLISFVRSKMNDKGEVSDTKTLEAINSVVTALIRNIADAENAHT